MVLYLVHLAVGDVFARVERVHHILEVGDDLEDALAERLGPDRATALRRAHDGWPGIRNQTENYCTGAEPVFF